LPVAQTHREKLNLKYDCGPEKNPGSRPKTTVHAPGFRAKIGQVGVNPCVAVPLRITRPFRKRGFIPVAVHLGKEKIRSTFVPLGQGRHRLYINAAMLRAAAAKVGDRILIRIESDPRPRTQKIPRSFAEKLAGKSRARKTWETLAPSRRKEVLMYLNRLKHPESLARNEARVIGALAGGPATHPTVRKKTVVP
jgi:Domain of unknown function (DUF1905)/Bacteriocin-protection, YdeI or OmpD-Associated